MRPYKILIASIWLVFTMVFLYPETYPIPPSNYLDIDAGSLHNPYLLNSLANLRWLSETHEVWGTINNKVHYIQTTDIDASETIEWNEGEGFYPIGFMSMTNQGNDNETIDALAFYGMYNGNNYQISNLYIHTISAPNILKSAGLFGYALNSSFLNIRLNNISLNGSYAVGSIAGIVANVDIINSYSTGEILGNAYNTGGLVGVATNSRIEECFTAVDINVDNDFCVGGLIGFMTGIESNVSRIRNSYFYGDLNVGTDYYKSGGIVGDIFNFVYIENVFVASHNIFVNAVGIVGNKFIGSLTNSRWDVETTGTDVLVSTDYQGIISNSYGLTTNEMKSVSTYTNLGWNIDTIWGINSEINNGYPYLRSLATTTSINDVAIMPKDVILHQNYPNPFNPETTISFSLNTDGFINLEVYNIKGQKVKSLVNEHKSSGTHSIVWNGTDDNNIGVSSGIYFYKIKTNNFTATKKITLMK
jgi:hypothetical protein